MAVGLSLALIFGAAVAQSTVAVPRKFGVVTVSAAPSGACSASAASQYRRVKGTGQIYACVSSTWSRVDLPDCGGTPSGACTGTAACVEGTRLYTCSSSTWAAATATGADVSCTDCVTLGTETSGNYAASTSEAGAATSIGDSSDSQVSADVDGDGTDDYCVSLRGPRGTATDVSGDGTDDQKLYPAIDYGCDGTAEMALTPSGFAAGNTRVGEIRAKLVIAGDNHGNDWSTFATECATYDVACTFNVTQGPDDTLPGDDEIQEYAAAGMEIGLHGAQHAMVSYDDADGHPDYGYSTTGGYGTYDVGTAVCTNGSATVTGTSTSWATNGSLTSAYSPRNAYFICDYDNDGTINATDRAHPYYIASVDSSTQITLDRAFGGTTSSPSRPYETRASWRHANWEVSQTLSEMQGILGTSYHPGYWVDPGTWEPSDDVATAAKAAQGILISGSYQSTKTHGADYLGWMTGGLALGAYNEPGKLSWHQSNCNWDNEYVNKLLALAVRENLVLLLNVHDMQEDASCSLTTQDIKRSTLQHLLSTAKSYQQNGQLDIVSGEQLIGYLKTIGPQSDNVNALRNSHFFMATSGAGSLGEAGVIAWNENDYDGTTAGVQGPSDLDCDNDGTGDDPYTWSGDGAGTLTWSYTGTTCTASISQTTRLGPGIYWLAVGVDARDMTAGVARFNVFDAFTQYTDLVEVLQPLWYQSLGGGWSYSSNPYGPAFAPGEAGYVIAQVRVPDGANEAFRFGFQVSGGTGTVRFRDPVVVRRTPVSIGTRYGGGNGMQQVQISRFDPSLTATYPYAFHDVWVPQEDQVADAPTNHLFGRSYVDSANNVKVVEYGDISADGTMDIYLTGDYYSGGDKVRDQAPYQHVEEFFDCVDEVAGSGTIDTNRCRTSSGACNMASTVDADPETGTSGYGVCQIKANAVAGGYAGLYIIDPKGTTSNALLTTTKVNKFAARVRSFSGGGTGFTTVVGAFVTSSNGDLSTITDGVYYWCDAAADTTWHAITMASSTSTDTDTNVSCTSGNFVTMEISYDGTNYVYTIDDAQKASHSTNKPTAVNGWFAWIRSTDASGNDVMYVDWLYYEGDR